VCKGKGEEEGEEEEEGIPSMVGGENNTTFSIVLVSPHLYSHHGGYPP
jgi:hypothetical protein